MTTAVDQDRVLIESNNRPRRLPRRLLDLNNVATPELKVLSPLEREIAPPGADRLDALSAYSDRLRQSYKQNLSGLRDGLKLLGETLEGGHSLGIACSCRNGDMCHADVVKIAVEKVRERIRERQKQDPTIDHLPGTIKPRSNPRTMRAIADILSVTRTDRVLESLDQTDGRNRSEHASHLNKSSQFTRDLYERGASVVDGKLLVPTERLIAESPLVISTQNYAVERIGRIIENGSDAKEIAPIVVEYGNKIAGDTSDRETKLKVFTWVYETLEGKTDLLEEQVQPDHAETNRERFSRNMEEIRILADEMSKLESTSGPDLTSPLADRSGETLLYPQHDEFSTEEIYEEAISRVSAEPDHQGSEDPHVEHENPIHQAGSPAAGFERIELASRSIPQLPSHLSESEVARLFSESLPKIDLQIENGVPIEKILEPFRKVVYQTAKYEPIGKAEAIDDVRFISSYIDYQLNQPDSRLRHENERYRNYADRLEKAETRIDVMTAASEIRAENAALGFRRGDQPGSDRRREQRPLTAKEMQFLFTEISPQHYTTEMTVARLANAQTGHGRQQKVEALLNGEIRASSEAEMLIKSLESRLQRRNVRDSIAATKHFFESLKTSNHALRYKNGFDHQEVYSKLPPAEKDFVYQRAVLQKQELERMPVDRSQPRPPDIGGMEISR